MHSTYTYTTYSCSIVHCWKRSFDRSTSGLSLSRLAFRSILHYFPLSAFPFCFSRTLSFLFLDEIHQRELRKLNHSHTSVSVSAAFPVNHYRSYKWSSAAIMMLQKIVLPGKHNALAVKCRWSKEFCRARTQNVDFLLSIRSVWPNNGIRWPFVRSSQTWMAGFDCVQQN